ncbi:MAG: PKD domain-containing protein, partial [Gemmatimonadales bacterium]
MGLFPQAVAFAGDGADQGASAPGAARPLEAKDAIANPSAKVAKLPRGASQDWWGKVQRGLATYEYRPSENARGLQAPNRAHNLRTYFGPTGIRLHDRTAAGSPELAGLSLAGIGRGENLEPVPAGTVNHSKTRVEIRRTGIVEWYENTPTGLEQGFTLPARMEGEGPLVLELAVTHAKARLRGQSIELASNAGRKLRYGKLIAKDANGQVLKSHLEVPSPQRIRLVVEDAGAAYPLVIDPLVTGESDAMLESNVPNVDGFQAAVFGGSVAGAGDVNGDGFPDVIVGALGVDHPDLFFDDGAVYVFLGSATGIMGSDPATAHAVIVGDKGGEWFGKSVAGAGDVNGDGFDDIVVGAPFYDSTLFFEGWGDLAVKGAAFVFYGGPLGITATSASMADARIDANQVDSVLGWSVAGAGDVNGDGFDDIIVGAIRQASPTFPPNISPNQGQGYGGAAVVFHGSAAGITATGMDDADATLVPYPEGFPESSQTFMGTYVAGAGDVNGDGFDDIIVNILGAAVFLGSPTGIIGTDPTTAHAHISGSGSVVSGAGDVNGDGFADIILGAPGLNEGTFGVFLGSTAGITATDFSQAQTIVQGDGGVLGIQVAGAGDVDNDGFDDVIVAARGYVGGLDSEGVAYVFRGGLDGIVASTLLDAYVRIESHQSEAIRYLNRSAIDVAGAGDIDGDGFADVIVGFGYYDAGELDEGAAFIYHGGPAPLNPNQWPVADAGPDQFVFDIDTSGSEPVTVDGSLSFDPDGSIVSYAWYEGETLLGTSPVLTTSLTASGDHRLVLTVTDNDGITRGDVVNVRVGVERIKLVLDDFFFGLGDWTIGGDALLDHFELFFTTPQVRLGATGAFLRRSFDLPIGTTSMTLKFSGKASQFSAADELLVKVSIDGGPFTTIHTITSAESNDSYFYYGGAVGAIPIGHSWFPATASNMVLEFESKMTTGLFFINYIEVLAVMDPAGTPPPPAGEMPVANAGADTTVYDNDSDGLEQVILDGIMSFDPDGTIVSYEWFEVRTEGTLPDEGTFPIGIGATVAPSFGRGSHIVQLIVTDNDGGSASDFVVVTVNQALADNQPPVANAGLDKTIVDLNGDTLEFVVFDGRGSTDPDGTIVSYNWTKDGNPFNNADRFTVQLPLGVHAVELTVTDNQGATSSPDTVVVTVVPVDPPPPIDSFSATPTSITAGESATLSWMTTGADSVVINAGPELPLDGSISVSPAATTLYILTAIGPAGAAQALVTVTVNSASPGLPTVDSFSAAPDSIAAGGSATLSWTTTDAASVTIDNGVGAVAVDGSVTMNPTATTAYTLTATGTGGTATSSVTVTVNPASPEPPTVDSFSATPTTIPAGDMAILSWTTTGADADGVSIDNGVGAGMPADGSRTVSPETTTTYILTATGPGGESSANMTVTVNSASSETLTITNFEYRADKNEWRIAGTSSIPGPGNTMTLYVGPTVSGSVTLGTAAVDGLGDWEYRERDSSVAPHSSGTISIQSSQGGTWEGISGGGPADPSGDPPPPSNLPPVAVAATEMTDEGIAMAITLQASDPDGDALSYSVPTPPASGTLSGTAPSLTYTPNAEFSGSDSFIFQVDDGNGGSDTATVSIIVNPANADPVSIAFDGFESGNFSGGSGAWIDIWTASGDVRIRTNRNQPHTGNSHVRL